MNYDEVIAWLKRQGYTQNTWGYWVKDERYRYKASKVMLAFHRKIQFPATQYSKASSEWMRLRSGYYKDLYLTPDDKLGGMQS